MAKECKDAQTQKGRAPPAARRPSVANSRRSDSMGDVDSDVDLDFLPDGGSEYPGPQTFGVTSTAAATPSADMAILQQPLHLAILQHSNQNSEPKANGPFVPSSATLPFHHGALSRAFVNTIGKLGRWKRVLNARNSAQVPNPAASDVSPFDLEPNATGDLLTVRGGVEQYLKMIETQTPKSPSTGASTSSNFSMSLPSTPSKEASVPLPVSENSSAIEINVSEPLHVVSEESEEDFDSQSVSIKDEDGSVATSQRSFSPVSYDSDFSRRQTFESSDESEPYTRRPGIWDNDIISIDDLDLSDVSSGEEEDEAEPEVPPGLRRVPRKLPLRRDFEFVRRSLESLSSIEERVRDSVASAASSSVASGSPEPELGPGIQQWQVNALADSLSDDEETGDVDAALRNLEGRISHAKQVVKQSKVDTWIKSIRDRMVTGNYGDERSRFPVDDEDNDGKGADEFGVLDDSSSISSRLDGASNQDVASSSPLSSPKSQIDTPLANHHVNGSRSGPASPVMTADAKPSIEDAVPLEILQSRVPSRPTTFGASIVSPSASNFNSIMKSSQSVFVGSKLHRSQFLGYRAGTLAEHFATIERELFMGLKFEELVVDDWMRSVEEANVYDWAQFLKDRARYKAEARGGAKTSALVAFRGRFNLCANFIVSEIVLTHPSERAVIVGKFIRVAWVSLLPIP